MKTLSLVRRGRKNKMSNSVILTDERDFFALTAEKSWFMRTGGFATA